MISIDVVTYVLKEINLWMLYLANIPLDIFILLIGDLTDYFNFWERKKCWKKIRAWESICRFVLSGHEKYTWKSDYDIPKYAR